MTWTMALLGLVLASPSVRQEPTPRVRVRLDPGPAVTVGQPIRVIVEVLVPSYFMGAPVFEDLDVDNSLVLFNDRGSNFTERDGPLTWAGQSRSYTIYPQVAGEYVIGGLSVRTVYFANGRTEATATSREIRFEAVLPSEAEGLGYFIATSRLRLQESYEPAPDTVRVGEAFERTVMTTVDNALAMVVPPLAVDSVPGFSVYPDPPTVDDRGGERGAAIVGTRVESITYVAQDTGAYTIPSLNLAWWDVDSSRMREATLPERSVVVVPNPDLAVAIALSPDSTTAPTEAEAAERLDVASLLRRFGPIVAVLVVVTTLLVRAARRRGLGSAERRARKRLMRAGSEAVYFDQFRKAVRTHDEAAVARTFMAWLDRWRGAPGLASAADFVTQAADAELEREAGAVGQALFGRPGTGAPWSGSVLTKSVEAARRAGVRDPSRGHDRKALPPLNP